MNYLSKCKSLLIICFVLQACSVAEKSDIDKAAKSILVPHPNSDVTKEIPSLDTDEIPFRLGTVPTASSIIFVILATC